MKMQSNSAISDSPSFNSCTDTDRLAEIAARVVQEFQAELDYDDYLFDQNEEVIQINRYDNNDDDVNNNKSEKDEDEDEFEFAFVATQQPDYLSPTVSADQIFYNGQIRPVYPLFNTALLFDHQYPSQPGTIGINSSGTDSSAARLPLAKLFTEERERDTAASCSSSEADELEGVAADSYCVWKPKSAEENSPGRCKKSGSTGTSKRWKFGRLLHRSNSEGRDSLVILAKKSVGKGKKEEDDVVGHHVNKEINGGRRKSYLPYKKDVGVVGLFANVNGVSRSLRPF